MSTETIGKHTKTAAPLIGLIVLAVYEYCENNFEMKKANHVIGKRKLSTIKAICCLLTNEIVAGDYDMEVCNVLHITDSTYSKYISDINYIQQRDHKEKDFIDLLRVEIVMKAIKEEKYREFIKQTIKHKLIINK